jgi:hypothetical protein
LEKAVLDGADLTKADLYGAQLQGAVLVWAYLQGASLGGAQLQGALLDLAQLQGASLGSAGLQGASLDRALLQGASLDHAHLQGAFLRSAQLQGASLVDAEVNATDFSDAFLWRTNWGEIDRAKLGAVRLDAQLGRWKPVWQKGMDSSLVPWDAKAYADLRGSMNSVPEAKMRDRALNLIETLDCGNSDKTLAACDPAAAPPPEVLDWQKKLAAAGADNAAYAKALATELRSLVCTSDVTTIHNLGSMIIFVRLASTEREAPALVDFIMSEDCPVSASLTGDDKAALLKIKQDAEKKFAPPPTSKKEK